MRVRARPITNTASARAPCRAASRNARPRLPRATRPRLHVGALAPSPWHRHSRRSRCLPHTRMPAHAHTSPALKSCPSVCRQHTGPGPCQCLQHGRCRRQPRRTVTRGLLRGRVPGVLRGHHRVFAHPHTRVPKSQVVMQGWVKEMTQMMMPFNCSYRNKNEGSTKSDKACC
jgi:hypothetical protein